MKSSLSSTFIYFNLFSWINFFCFVLISSSKFFLISINNFIFSKSLFSIMNFYIASIVFGSWVYLESLSITIVFIPNFYRFTMSHFYDVCNLLLTKGIIVLSAKEAQEVVWVIIKWDVLSVNFYKYFSTILLEPLIGKNPLKNK